MLNFLLSRNFINRLLHILSVVGNSHPIMVNCKCYLHCLRSALFVVCEKCFLVSEKSSKFYSFDGCQLRIVATVVHAARSNGIFFYFAEIISSAFS